MTPRRSKIRSPIFREVIAEFLATFFLTVCGDGVVAVLTFRRAGDISLVAGPFSWGASMMIAICIAGGISGGHANPATTLALATVGRCSWTKVLPYMLAQYCGGFVAGVVIYFVYHDAFDRFDGGLRQIPPHENSTAQIFSCFPMPFVSTASCLVDQVVGTSLLLMMVSAVTDDKNLGVPRGFQPLLAGFGIATILLGFGYNCIAPLNPARDLGPRLASAALGWGTGVFSYRDYCWFWVPMVGPYIGGVVGAQCYYILIKLQLPSVSSDYHVSCDGPTDLQIKRFPNQANSIFCIQSPKETNVGASLVEPKIT